MIASSKFSETKATVNPFSPFVKFYVRPRVTAGERDVRLACVCLRRRCSVVDFD